MKFCLLLVFLISAATRCTADLFVIYGDASALGNVIKVISSAGELQKTFKVNTRSIQGIAIHYKQDLIFVVDRSKIVKIHLLDDDGIRKISGTGELFVDPKVSHFESVLISLSSIGITVRSSGTTCLMVDSTNNKLYIGGEKYVFEMDFDGSNVRKAIMAPEAETFAYMNHLTLVESKLYVGVSDMQNKENGVYQAVIDPRAMVNLTNASLILEESNIYAIAGENTSRSFYYINNNYQIHLMPPVQKKVIVKEISPLQKPRIVLSNFGVTNNPRALAVIGRNMFWSSDRYRKLYRGKLNGNMNFLPLQNISVVEENIQVLQMVVFETSTGAVINTSVWFLLAVVMTNFVV